MIDAQVQTEMERATAGGRIVDQWVSPLTPTPNVAGFRFDAPAAIRLASKYTMSAFSERQNRDEIFSSSIDESFISPASLRIRVSVVHVCRFRHPTLQPCAVYTPFFPSSCGGGFYNSVYSISL